MWITPETVAREMERAREVHAAVLKAGRAPFRPNSNYNLDCEIEAVALALAQRAEEARREERERIVAVLLRRCICETVGLGRQACTACHDVAAIRNAEQEPTDG